MVPLTALIRINELATSRLPRSAATPSLPRIFQRGARHNAIAASDAARRPLDPGQRVTVEFNRK